MSGNVKNFNRFIKGVSIRVDFYSLYEFRECFFKALQKKKGGLCFESRAMTEDERQDINIDSVSYNLSVTFEDILSRTCLFVDPIHFDGFDMEIIVGSHFLYCNAKIIDYVKYDKVAEDTFCNILNFREFKDKLSLVDIECHTHTGVFINNLDDRKHIFKDGFFPNDYSGLINARYVDSKQGHNGVNLDLIREYRMGINEITSATAHSFIVDSIAKIGCEDYEISKELIAALKDGINSLAKVYNE